MEDMESAVFIWLISSIIGLIILYYIIKSAVSAGSRSEEIISIQRQQLAILSKLLEHQGVSKFDVDNIKAASI
jgi:hypothetical protein